MTRQLSVLIALLLNISITFAQTDTTFRKADHYKTNKFDVAIFPGNYVDMIPGKRFTPTKQEVDKAEITLAKDLMGRNKQFGINRRHQ